MKNDVFEVKSSQDGSWGDLGSVLVAKRGRLGAPNRPQIGPKSRPKIAQIFDRILSDFWTPKWLLDHKAIARRRGADGRGVGHPRVLTPLNPRNRIIR